MDLCFIAAGRIDGYFESKLKPWDYAAGSLILSEAGGKTTDYDGNPIPTFTGEPERISVPNDIDEFTKDIWENLDEANKISLYVRYTSLEDGSAVTRIINKNK